MKRLFTLLLSVVATVGAFAQSSSGPTAYYPLPDGVFYIGVNIKGSSAGSEIVLAPADVNLTFKAAIDEDFTGDYAWLAEDFGIDELDNEDLVVSHAAASSLVTTPTLYVVGRGGYNTYQMARSGMAFGYGYLPDGDGNEYFAANYNAEELGAQFYDGTLFVNYPDGTTALNSAFSDDGKPYTNVTLRGFAEQFSYAKDYLLKTVRAGVVTDQELDTTDVEAKVYAIAADGSVGTTPIAVYKADSLYLHETDPNFYGIDFKCAEDVKITSPIMVVITPSETTDKRFGPELLVTQEQHNGEKGTAYLYGDYTVAGTQHTGDYISYADETFHSYGRTFYMRHWNVSLKQDYDTSSGITRLEADQPATSKTEGVYSLTGVKLGKDTDLSRLPKGLYIVNGKKVLKP